MASKRRKSPPDATARLTTPAPLGLDPKVLAGVALVVIAVFTAYWPSINGGFVLDDDKLLTDNPLIKAEDGLYRFWLTTQAYDYWPISNSSLWFEWRLWGMHPTGYHVTNLILHVAGTLLIWATLHRLSIPGAFLAALLFAVHPVNVETVAWIAQRKGLLALLFLLMSALSYLKSETARNAAARVAGWYWISLAAFVLAMLSKVSAAVLPLLLLVIIWWKRPLGRRDWVQMLPFFGVDAVLLQVNLWFRSHGTESPVQAAGLVERLLGAGAAIWFYLYKALVPLDLVFIYPQWHIAADRFVWWLPLLAALILTAALWSYRQAWSRPALVAWAFFCIGLIPVLGFTDVGLKQHLLVADHYQHLALIAVLTLTAAAWSTWRARLPEAYRRIAVIVAGMVVMLLVGLTWRQSRLYVDALTLYEATLARNPDSWMAHTNLGAALFRDGRHAEATAHFEQAVRLKPDYPEAHNNLGSELSHAGRQQEAIEQFEEALRLWPNFREAHYNLGLALAASGQQTLALDHLRRALQINPFYPEVHYHLGLTLAQSGHFAESIEHFRNALQLNPEYAEAYNNLGTALGETGALDEAITNYRVALRLKPDYADAQRNLATVLAMKKAIAEQRP